MTFLKVQTVFLLTFISLVAFSKPPYSGTLWVDPDIIIETDPSTFVTVESLGTGTRQMYDRRKGWIEVDAILFYAFYMDGRAIEIQINPEFSEYEAKKYATFYGNAIGQLPSILRKDVDTVWIHKGNETFGGGNRNLLIHTENPDYHGIWLEETLFHEACHTSLDSWMYNSTWTNAQILDDAYISEYARDFPNREDIAESCALYYAIKFKPERVSAITKDLIKDTIPNRLNVFDSISMTPITYSDKHPTFDSTNMLLEIPSVKIEKNFYKILLKLTDQEDLVFSLISGNVTSEPGYEIKNIFVDSLLEIPFILIGEQGFSLQLQLLTSSDQITFKYLSHQEVNLGLYFLAP